jgi:hypothetical protein
MNRLMLWASTAVFSFAVATPVFADSLNPQPEPPGKSKMTHNAMQNTTKTSEQAGGGGGPGKTLVVHQTLGSHTQNSMLNPQPLPPGRSGVTKSGATSAAATHGFNPQPDPPGKQQNQTQTQ